MVVGISTRQKPGISHKQVQVGGWISMRLKPGISHKQAQDGGWISTRQKPGILHKQVQVGGWISTRRKPGISHKRAYLHHGAKSFLRSTMPVYPFELQGTRWGKVCQFCADGNCAKSVFFRSAAPTKFATPVPPSG